MNKLDSDVCISTLIGLFWYEVLWKLENILRWSSDYFYFANIHNWIDCWIWVLF